MNERSRTSHSSVYVYRGTVPPLLGILLVIPLLLAFVSLFAVLLAGGALATVLVPLLVRRRVSRLARDGNTIELAPDQYSRVDSETARRHVPND
jgi:hypothetical protein